MWEHPRKIREREQIAEIRQFITQTKIKVAVSRGKQIIIYIFAIILLQRFSKKMFAFLFGAVGQAKGP